MSREGRRRVAMNSLKLSGLIIAAAFTAWGVWEVWRTSQDNPTKLAAPVKSEPLRAITLRTDGVLDLAWVERTLNLPKGVTLMELQLPRLQQRLMIDGQVRSAVLTRKFPDTLVVTLQERSPVVRIRAADTFGIAADFVVARDGVVFTGTNFDAATLEVLPWLDGVKLVRAGAGFQPVSGMETVAELLVAAQGNAPHLYRTWKVVSLERFSRDGELVVRSSEVKEIIFGLRDDFFTQLALLDSVLADERAQTQGPVASINLGLGNRQVPVAFEVPPPALVPAAAPGQKRPTTAGAPPGSDRVAPSAARQPNRPFFTVQAAQPRNAPRDL